MKEQTSNWAFRSKEDAVRLASWTVAWLVTMAVATFGPEFIWHSNSLLTTLAILINTGIGIGMIVANKRYLKGLDEMQQKIHVESMAISLGVGIVGGFSYSLLDITNLISTDAEISHLVVLMGLTYIAGIIVGQVRYR